jgi:hypothetical protein
MGSLSRLRRPSIKVGALALTLTLQKAEKAERTEVPL